MSDTASIQGSSNDELLQRVRDLEIAVEELRRALAQNAISASQSRGATTAQTVALSTSAPNVPQAPERAIPYVPEPPPQMISGYYVQPALAGQPPAMPAYIPQQYQAQQQMQYQTQQVQAPVQYPQVAPKPSEPFSARAIHAAVTWMPKIGIVIFLFGVVFLFKYTLDQGWVNEQVRVGSGLLLGTILIGVGLRIDKQRRRFAAVLLGGGIATYYITAFAAYNLFPSLHVPISAVFGFIVVVTAAAFLLSLRYNEVMLSIIGVAGGLLTPIALNSPQIELWAIVAYTCLVVAGACAIYMERGWRALLWTAVPCAWGALYFCFVIYVFNSYNFDSSLLPLNRVLLQGGALFLSIAFWALPVLREVLVSINPERWRTPPTPLADTFGISFFMKYQAQLFTLVLPAWAALYSVLVWSSVISAETWGSIALVVSLLFAGAYFALKRYPLPSGTLAYTHAIVAVGFVTVGISGVLHGDVLLVALALEATALYLIARRAEDRGMEIFGDIIFVIVAIWLGERLLSFHRIDNPIWNAPALTDLAVIGIALAASFNKQERTSAIVLRSGALLAVVAWLGHELIWPHYGVYYVLLAWAAYAVLLHGVSFLAKRKDIEWAAHGLSLVTGGLLLILILLDLLFVNEDRTPVFSAPGLTTLGVVLLGVAAYWLVNKRGGISQIAFVYALWLHFAFLGWVWQEIGLIPGGSGNAYVSIVWGVYAVCLVVAGLRLDRNMRLLTCGISTLFALAAKLFLIDLQYVDAIWRIVLFLGFGGFFLIFSYLFQSKIGRAKDDSVAGPGDASAQEP